VINPVANPVTPLTAALARTNGCPPRPPDFPAFIASDNSRRNIEIREADNDRGGQQRAFLVAVCPGVHGRLPPLPEEELPVVAREGRGVSGPAVDRPARELAAVYIYSGAGPLVKRLGRGAPLHLHLPWS